MQNQALTMIYEDSSRMKRQNAVSAHLRTNLPRDHSAAQAHSDTASFVISERRDPGQSTLNEKNKSRHWLYYRGITQSFRLLQITVSQSPPIFIDDIGERDTADWPEPTHGISER